MKGEGCSPFAGACEPGRFARSAQGRDACVERVTRGVMELRLDRPESSVSNIGTRFKLVLAKPPASSSPATCRTTCIAPPPHRPAKKAAARRAACAFPQDPRTNRVPTSPASRPKISTALGDAQSQRSHSACPTTPGITAKPSCSSRSSRPKWDTSAPYTRRQHSAQTLADFVRSNLPQCAQGGPNSDTR